MCVRAPGNSDVLALFMLTIREKFSLGLAENNVGGYEDSECKQAEKNESEGAYACAQIGVEYTGRCLCVCVRLCPYMYACLRARACV